MAAPILAYEDLGLVQGAGWLFRHLDLYIQPRDRLALIGRNGAGKTTLLKLIAGKIDADEGRRTIVPGTKVILLEQEPDLTGFTTLADYVLSAPDAPQHFEAEAIAAADRAGSFTIAAGRHFNHGLRAFFFAVGYLGWFVNGYVLIVTTTAILLVQLYRQFLSPSARLVIEAARQPEI